MACSRTLHLTMVASWADAVKRKKGFFCPPTPAYKSEWPATWPLSLSWMILASSSICSQHLYHLYSVKENKRWSPCTKKNPKNQERNIYFCKLSYPYENLKWMLVVGRGTCANSLRMIFLLSLEGTLINLIQIQKRGKKKLVIGSSLWDFKQSLSVQL